MARECLRAVVARAVSLDEACRSASEPVTKPVAGRQRDDVVGAELLLEAVDPIWIGPPKGLDRGIGIPRDHERAVALSLPGGSRKEVEHALLYEGELLPVVHEDVQEAVV